MFIIPDLPDMYAGDDVTWDLVFTDANGAAIDITGSTINFIVKTNKSDADANAKINKNVTVHTDPTAGESQLVLTDVETAVTPGVYWGEFTFTSSAGLITTLASTQQTILDKVKD